MLELKCFTTLHFWLLVCKQSLRYPYTLSRIMFRQSLAIYFPAQAVSLDFPDTFQLEITPAIP